jgi:hypothetical protein
MTPEAKLLARALLHWRTEHASDTTLNSDAYLISYSDLCQCAGVPEIRPNIGAFLREIAEWCDANAWPPLNSLAVNYHTHKPGPGYDHAPGCRLKHWPDQVAACICFTGYPKSI